MKKLVALGLAGALAAASVSVTTSEANASGLGAFLLGAVVGGATVAIIHDYHPFRTAAYGYYVPGTDHASWCKSHYRTYRLATNSFTGYDGYQHRCVSPY